MQLSDRLKKSLKKISCHLIFKYFTKIKAKAQMEPCFDSEILKKTTKFRKFSSYLNQNRDFCSLEVKKKISTKPCLDRNLSFCGNIRLILNKQTNIREKLWKYEILHFQLKTINRDKYTLIFKYQHTK